MILLCLDPDDDAERDDQPERVRDAVLPVLAQAVHHPRPPGEECSQTHYEHKQVWVSAGLLRRKRCGKHKG